jgi:predicted enzyme related to lactoylglutathione lyase
MKKTTAINWFEIPVTNMERAKQFYNSIFNIKLQDLELGGNEFAFFPDEMSGGALAKGEGYIPSQTGSLCYLNGGNDLNGVLEKIEGAGGKVILPKTNIGQHGFIARFIDSEDNMVALHSQN